MSYNPFTEEDQPEFNYTDDVAPPKPPTGDVLWNLAKNLGKVILIGLEVLVVIVILAAIAGLLLGVLTAIFSS